MDFPKFGQLPMELQLEVWKHAAVAESRERVVLLHGNFVVPRRQLVSSFLSTTQASRYEALKVYSASLPVVDLPKFLGPAHNFRVRLQICTSSVSRSIDAARYTESWGLLEAQLASFARRPDSRVGVLYLSPRHDTFVIGLNFAPLYLWGLCPNLPSARWSRFITESLPVDTRQHIRRTVLAEPKLPSSVSRLRQRGGYSAPLVESLWEVSEFPRASPEWHLWMKPPSWELPAGIVEYEILGSRGNRVLERGMQRLQQQLDDIIGVSAGAGERSQMNIRRWCKVGEVAIGTGEVVDLVGDPGEVTRASI